jgi:hypothetical protein
MTMIMIENIHFIINSNKKLFFKKKNHPQPGFELKRVSLSLST